MDREHQLLTTFVEFADTLLDDYDVNEFLHRLTVRCAELVQAKAVGVLLAGAKGGLQLVAASTHDMHALELFEIQQRQGPCYDAYTSGQQIVADDLEADAARWPEFVPQALERGLRSVHAFPLRVRDQRLGALNVFFDTPGPFSESDILALQALADVAAMGVLQQRHAQDSIDLADQLQTALDSRVVIERAVGILVERRGLRTDEAFESIRDYARSNNRRLRAVAQAIVDGAVKPDSVDSAG